MTLEERMGNLIFKRSLKLGLAESCTGGLIAARVTDVAGSSRYFEGGLVTYSNEAKMALLKVDREVLASKGAVSAETAELMARGTREALGVDMALSVTGVAGPSGGSPEKPVGTVFMALATEERVFVRKHFFQGNRQEIRGRTADEAFLMIIHYLEGDLLP